MFDFQSTGSEFFFPSFLVTFFFFLLSGRGRDTDTPVKREDHTPREMVMVACISEQVYFYFKKSFFFLPFN